MGAPTLPILPLIPFPALLCSRRRKGSNQGGHSWQPEQIPGDAPASRDNGAQRCAPKQDRGWLGFAVPVLPHIPVPKERPAAGQDQDRDCKSWVHPAARDDKAALAALAAAGNGCHLSGAAGTCPKPPVPSGCPPSPSSPAGPGTGNKPASQGSGQTGRVVPAPPTPWSGKDKAGWGGHGGAPG